MYCCSRGEILIKAYFDGEDYKAGDVATILTEIDNSKSSKGIEKVTG